MGQAFGLHIYGRSFKVIVRSFSKSSDMLIVILVIRIHFHVLLFPGIRGHRNLFMLTPWHVDR